MKNKLDMELYKIENISFLDNDNKKISGQFRPLLNEIKPGQSFLIPAKYSSHLRNEVTRNYPKLRIKIKTEDDNTKRIFCLDPLEQV
jgi:hypothetical protein